MSTEHQKYSTENQSDAIRCYAEQRGMEIVRTYTDAGRSGLNIDGRAGLQRLLADVRTGAADFSIILVYDVSRWGRFQDSDEPAAYEYACRAAGVRVAYCAELFENDGSIGSDVQKLVKRRMAAEYSRELSVKVFTGQRRLVKLGYRLGGSPGYGLRRQLIDENGAPKGELVLGQKKSIQTDRVVLVPGPRREVAIVRRIYEDFVHAHLNEVEIAERLNRRGIVTDLGRAWTRDVVHQVLINEKYIGNNVWNRKSTKLKQRRKRNEPDLWIRVDGAFSPIVERALFDAAQEKIRARYCRLTNEELLQVLRNLLSVKGHLSERIIDAAPTTPSGGVYQSRFGSLLEAYRLIGYSPTRNFGYLEIDRFLQRLHPKIVAQIVEGIALAGGKVTKDACDLLTVNEEFSVGVMIVRCRETPAGAMRWTIRLDRSLVPDVTVVVRMNRLNMAVRDYLILPTKYMDSDVMCVSEHNEITLDAFLFDSLHPLFQMSQRVPPMEVAPCLIWPKESSTSSPYPRSP